MVDKVGPRCESQNIAGNGNTDYGKPRYMCKDCRRHFVENPAKRKISDEQKELIDKLLLEKLSLAGIARVAGVSQRWLYSYVHEKQNASRK